MRKFRFWQFGLYTGISLSLLSSCKNDSQLAAAPSIADQSFTEEFDTVPNSINRGWQFINVSVPKGSDVWQQGGAIVPWFAPYSSNGSNAGFIGANYLSTSAQKGVISNWLVSPVVIMQNGDKISFYTRSYMDRFSATDSTDWGNCLQVRANTTNESSNVGSGLNIGDFKTGLLQINQHVYSNTQARDTLAWAHTATNLFNYAAYPTRWTRYEAVISGLNAPARGRFAFRYFLENGGSNSDGSGIAIDKVQYTSVGH